MDDAKADLILQLAIQKGLLDENQVKALKSELETIASPAADFFEKGSTLPRASSYGSRTASLDINTLAEIETPAEHQSNQRLGRYVMIKLLGEGGMGTVYQAYDPVLKRYVAIKIIRGGDPLMVERLLREGRAQAKIEHPNVCKVYEVGQVDGQFFIAMQFINGQTLNTAMRQMTLEQKVRVIADVAEGLHAAHKEGLIHRDIKPQNIMVEKTEDGLWKAYVLDFGIVREVSAQGMTVSGALLGTPKYMSPEQVSCELALDRRTDVYSLGVTLHELIIGKAPFESEAAVGVLLKVIEKEPEPLRKLDARVPADLETIVLKCLQKEPQLRYESARALQEDLLRFLAGEPILARRASLFYRINKKIRKNRTVAAVLAVTIVVAMAVALAGVRAWWQAGKRAQLAREFGEQVREIQSTMRYAYLSPLHDIREDEGIVREQMAKIEAMMRNLGSLGDGPGHYALGRGYEALGEYEEAKKHLEAAGAAGYRQAETSYALGLVMGELYRQRLAELERISSKELRESEQRRAEAELKEPALKYLAEGRQASGESSEYGEALLAYYDKRWEEALTRAQAAVRRFNWLYEAQRLIGDIHVAIANEKRNKGLYQEADLSYQQARRAYEQALDISASDARNYRSLANMLVSVMRAKQELGKEAQQEFDDVIKLSEAQLKANPQRGEAYIQMANAALWLGRIVSLKGKDPIVYYQRGIDYAQKAIGNRHTALDAYIVIGHSYHQIGDYRKNLGGDPLPSFAQGIASFEKARELDGKNIEAFSGLGKIYSIKGDYLDERGEQPVQSYEQAINSYRKALEIDPKFTSAWNNVGIAYRRKASYHFSRGQVAAASFQPAIDAYRNALAINPKLAFAYNGLGVVYNEDGEQRLNRGEDPSASITRGLESLTEALKINPNFTPAINNSAVSHILLARYQLSRGQDPLAEVEQAIECSNRSIKTNAKNPNAFFNAGQANLVKADYLIKTGQNAAPALAAAERLLRQSIELNDEDYFTFQHQARGLLLEVRWQALKKRAVAPFLARAHQAIERAITLNRVDGDNYAVKAEIYLAQARLERDPARRNQYIQSARQVFDRALSINPLLATKYRAVQEEFRELQQ